jgi:hypothetical protein
MLGSVSRALLLTGRIAGCVLATGAGLLMLAAPATASTAVPAPAFTCAAANGDGTFTYFFGYTLAGTASVTVPIGPDNQFTGGDKNLGQPTTFLPGNHDHAFSVTTASASMQWHLSGSHVKVDSSQLCTNMPVVSESPAALVFPFAATVPFVVWFFAMRRRARRATT